MNNRDEHKQTDQKTKRLSFGGAGFELDDEADRAQDNRFIRRDGRHALGQKSWCQRLGKNCFTGKEVIGDRCGQRIGQIAVLIGACLREFDEFVVALFFMIGFVIVIAVFGWAICFTWGNDTMLAAIGFVVHQL